jgi:hypothetical protein
LYMFCRPKLLYVSSWDSYFHTYSPPSTHFMRFITGTTSH